MAIQRSGGTLHNTTFTGTDISTIISAVETALTTAGWSVVSGASTDDVVLQSALTGQSNRIRVRLVDLGGNCVSVKINNASGTLTQSDSSAGHLLPGVGKTFRIIATRYQCVIWVPGSTASREFVLFSAMYISTFLTGSITSLGLLVSNSFGDASAAAVASFRTSLACIDGSGAPSNYFAFVNSSTSEAIASSSSPGYGGIQFVIPQGAFIAEIGGFRWYDNSASAVTPALAWGLTGIGDEPKRVGQLWDSFLSSESYVMDDTFPFDSNTWINITSSNNGVDGEIARGSLLYLYS